MKSGVSSSYSSAWSHSCTLAGSWRFQSSHARLSAIPIFFGRQENIARTRKERLQKGLQQTFWLYPELSVDTLHRPEGLEDDEEEALDQLRLLEEEMHDICSEPLVAFTALKCCTWQTASPQHGGPCAF